MELWDVFDENRISLDRTVERGKPMGEREYHLVSMVIIYNKKGEILLTRRSSEKKRYSHMWENTGGSVVSGEDTLTGAYRETLEETGLNIPKENFVLIDAFKRPRENNHEYNCHVDIFIVKSDADISEVKLQEGETCDAKWLDFESWKDGFIKGEIVNSVSEIALRKPFADKVEEHIKANI